MNYKSRIGPADTAQAALPKHIATPWFAFESKFVDKDYWTIQSQRSSTKKMPAWAIAVIPNFQNNDEANARFIVTACNAHDDLLLACETLRSAMVHMQEFDRLPDYTCPADLIDYLSAAIARAEKEGV